MRPVKGTRKWCFVPACSSSSAKTSGKLFVSVPMEIKTRRMWASAARREDAKTLTSRNPWYCCEDHFEPEKDFSNYMKQKLMGGKVQMKKCVIPHKFACQKGRHKEIKQRLSSHRRQQTDIVAHVMMDCEDQVVCRGEREDDHGRQGAGEDTTDQLEVEMQTNQAEPSKVASQASQTEPCPSASQATQTESVLVHGAPDEVLPNAQELLADANDRNPTGCESDYSPSSPEAECDDEEEDHIDYLSLHRTRTMCRKFPKRYIGIPEDALWVVERLATDVVEPLHSPGAKLSPYDVCLLVLMKVKQDRQFAYLADDFGISRSYAGRIFAKFVGEIGDALSDFIVWPNEETIRKNLPLAFKARFSRVTCIIDCLEIEIEKPSAAINQSLTWSSYKACNTLKYLISITPNGLINFISEGFGGRASDMAVLKRSSFLNCLKPGMVIMADRGFKAVESALVNEGCSLVRPESVTASAVLDKDQVLWSKQVASLRIHVERAIRRVREFAMLRPHAVIDAKLADYADSYMAIACGLVNVQPPLTKV